MGTQPPLQKGGRAPPQFLAHFYCGQMAGCTKIPLGMELGLSPGDFVLDGDTALSPKKVAEPLPPNFWPMFIVANGWMDEAGTWHGDTPQSRRLCYMGTQPPLPKGGRAPSPIFDPFLLWPNGCMHQDSTWYGCRPQPRGLCVR